MNNFALFTDVSLNPQRRLGIGAYLLLPLSFLENEPDSIEQVDVAARLKFKRFTETSSTKLEVQTVLWGVKDSHEEMTGSARGSLQIYTDSQCVAGLLRRRAGLTGSGFISKRSGVPLAHAPLYREFYEAFDQHGFSLNKVSGHSRASSHDTVHRIFSYVDREVRKALALWLESGESPCHEIS